MQEYAEFVWNISTEPSNRAETMKKTATENAQQRSKLI